MIVGWKWDLGITMFSYNFFAGIAKVPLLAIPFFILAGYIMEKAGIAARIVNFVEACVGNMTGGLAIATVAVATFWGAVSGSGPATVAALGLILIPAMVKNGYDKPFAAATVSVTSGLAIVIPPSIAFIVYGGIADVSVSALFAAGIIPGLIVAGFLMITVYIISRRRGWRGKPRTVSLWRAFKEAFWGLMTPVVILGGIYGGVFTPTEAAAVAIFYGLFVGIFIYRTMRSPMAIFEVLGESMKATAVIMFVVTCAGLFAWVASTIGLVEKGAQVLLSISDNPWVLLFLINLLLLAAGMLLDAISIYYVLLPFLLPLVRHFGWDPVWFGVMMTVNLAVGQVTPPVAVNLYVGAKISDLTMEDITPPVLPLLAACVLALAFIVAFPGITTYLPRLFGL
jgi:C4-dicarboxylate transporter DctM subunit